MIITCGQCLAKFKVAPEQIKETGSKVRCSNCQHVFTVYRPGSEPNDRETDRPPLYYRPVENPEGGLDPGNDDLYDRNANADHFHDDDYDDGQDYDDDAQYDDSDADLYSADYPAQERYASSKRNDAETLSLKERRDRRRRLYADMEEETDQEYETEEDIDYEEEDLLGENGRPPLRRASARAAQQERQTSRGYEDETYEDGEEEAYEEEYEEEEYEEEYEGEEEEYGEYDDDSAYEEDDDEYEIPVRGERRSSLGLAADPVENVAGFIDDADYRGHGQVRGSGGEVRAAVTKVSKGLPLPLIIILAIVVIVLAVGAFFFLTGRSAPTALSAGDPVNSGTVSGSDGQGLIDTDKDSDGTKHITFTRGSQNHYWRQNNEAGQILIITGMVRNSYPEPRSFIRLRGHILAADGTSLADRFVYAGNLISEDDLKTLPSSEILNRLSNRGGQNGRNMNIPSGTEIPFMIVFDKLPDGMSEYRIDPVGSSPAQ